MVLVHLGGPGWNRTGVRTRDPVSRQLFALFVMSPHSQNTNGLFLSKNFVNKAMLNVNSS